jgi:hypothetical protein
MGWIYVRDGEVDRMSYPEQVGFFEAVAKANAKACIPVFGTSRSTTAVETWYRKWHLAVCTATGSASPAV